MMKRLLSIVALAISVPGLASAQTLPPAPDLPTLPALPALPLEAVTGPVLALTGPVLSGLTDLGLLPLPNLPALPDLPALPVEIAADVSVGVSIEGTPLEGLLPIYKDKTSVTVALRVGGEDPIQRPSIRVDGLLSLPPLPPLPIAALGLPPLPPLPDLPIPDPPNLPPLP